MLFHWLKERLFLLFWFFQLCHSKKYWFNTSEIHDSEESLLFEKLSIPELFGRMENLLKNLDPSSVKVCEAYFYYFYYFLRSDTKIIDKDFLFSPKVDKALFRERFATLNRKYRGFHLSDPYEIVLYHHGLVMLKKEALAYIENKIFVDAGACNGDSSLVLLEYNLEKIYAFDISAVNNLNFMNRMKINEISSERVELIPMGLGDSEMDMFFTDGKDGGTTLLETGTSKAHITTLDVFLENSNPVGFIKADVEGFGYKMLVGMEKILRRDRPVLSLSIYHNAEEFLQMKPFLESLELGYNIRIVPLCHVCYGEISILAVPQELM